jgi:hypothetical protein
LPSSQRVAAMILDRIGLGAAGGEAAAMRGARGGPVSLQRNCHSIISLPRGSRGAHRISVLPPESRCPP